MAIIPRLLLVLVVVIAPIVVYATSAGLPMRVASHFGAGGLANGWMPRDTYVALMVALTALLPLLVAATIGFTPDLTLRKLKGSAREYWNAPHRRPEVLVWLKTHSCWLGILLALFLSGVHLQVVRANARTPPRLDEPQFIVLLVVFAVLAVAWVVRLTLRFRVPRGT
ncbi:MAG: DUF1648 domain-containing protein [Burkholderiales bacterium]|nr:DUF1648 domain-containing protein [Burkholderiales bacterium]